jgi:hypothetical protein
VPEQRYQIVTKPCTGNHYEGPKKIAESYYEGLQKIPETFGVSNHQT